MLYNSVWMYPGLWHSDVGTGIRCVLLPLDECSTSLHFIVKNYSGLLATRFFLGLAEAGIFPGSMSCRIDGT